MHFEVLDDLLVFIVFSLLLGPILLVSKHLFYLTGEFKVAIFLGLPELLFQVSEPLILDIFDEGIGSFEHTLIELARRIMEPGITGDVFSDPHSILITRLISAFILILGRLNNRYGQFGIFFPGKLLVFDLSVTKFMLDGSLFAQFNLLSVKFEIVEAGLLL